MYVFCLENSNECSLFPPQEMAVSVSALKALRDEVSAGQGLGYEETQSLLLAQATQRRDRAKVSTSQPAK